MQVFASSGGRTWFGMKVHPSVRMAWASTAGVVILQLQRAWAERCGLMARA
jgi:hypothetical protein